MMPANRLYCFLLCGLLSPLSLYAQQENFFQTAGNETKVFYSGIVAGINASQVDGDTYAGFHKAGLNAGLASYARLSPTFLMSVEMLYSMKGARNVQNVYSAAVGTVPLIYSLKLNYVEIPLMLHINAKNNIYLGAGLSYSRLLSSRESLDSDVPVNLQTEANIFRKDDLNYLVSIQYQLYKGFIARARYQYSIISIRDRAHIPEFFNSGAQYNNLFALQLMYLF